MSLLNKKAEKGKKINFRKIEIEDLAKKIEVIDISQILGNILYMNTGDIGMLDIARKIYYEGEIELTKKFEDELTKLLDDPKCLFTAVLKEKLKAMIKDAK